MQKTFKSPQTGSLYQVHAEVGDFIIAWREIDDEVKNACRVRIQGPEDSLVLVKELLQNGFYWSEVKSGDHISVVVYKANLIYALEDAHLACLRYCADKW